MVSESVIRFAATRSVSFITEKLFRTLASASALSVYLVGQRSLILGRPGDISALINSKALSLFRNINSVVLYRRRREVLM